MTGVQTCALPIRFPVTIHQVNKNLPKQAIKGIRLVIKPSAKQHEAYTLLNDHVTGVLLYGGSAGGGKSWLIGEWLMLLAVRYPEVRLFMARKELKVLKRSTLVTFFKVCRHHGIKKGVHYQYNSQDGQIKFYNGSTIDLLEIKDNPSDPMFEDLGSLEYTAGAIDEGGEVSFNAFETLYTRVGRHLNEKYNLHGKLLVTANPKKNWMYTYFYKSWKEGKQGSGSEYKFLQSFATDNPFLDDAYRRKLQSIKDPVRRKRLLLGEWEYEDDPASLIRNYDYIVDLFTNPVKAEGKWYITLDVARYGKDTCVMKLWHGLVMKKRVTWKKTSIPETAKKLREFAVEHSVPYSQIIVDEDGVGGGVVDLCEGVKGFMANSTPVSVTLPDGTKSRPNFGSLKDQCGYLLADYVNGHKMLILHDGDEAYRASLSEELEYLKEKYVDDDEKKKKLKPKDEIKDAIGRSPDDLDNLIMRMFFELGEEFTAEDDSDNLPEVDEYVSVRYEQVGV